MPLADQIEQTAAERWIGQYRAKCAVKYLATQIRKTSAFGDVVPMAEVTTFELFVGGIFAARQLTEDGGDMIRLAIPLQNRLREKSTILRNSMGSTRAATLTASRIGWCQPF